MSDSNTLGLFDGQAGSSPVRGRASLVLAGVPLRPLTPIVIALAALTAVMALSPVTLLTGLILIGIVAGACRGLTGTERRLVLTTMAVAIGIRVALILALFLVSEPNHIISFPYDGDGLWEKLRSLWIRNHWLGVAVHPRQLEDAITLYGWSSYIWLMAYVQYLLGPSPYAVHLLSVCCFVGSAVMLYRVIRRPFGPTAAYVALTAMLFMPTLLMWSVAAMRESFYLLALTLFAVGLVWAGRQPSLLLRLCGVALALFAIWLGDTIRVGAIVILAASGAVAVAGNFVTRRPYLLLIAALAVVPVGVKVIQRPAVQARVLDRLREAAIIHRGNVREEGHGYKLLDQRLYQIEPFREGAYTMTWPEAERYLVRGLIAVVVLPVPWDTASTTELLFIPQQIIWYAVVVLALAGAIRGMRTAPMVTWALIGLGAVTCVLMAPNEGNVGTMVRHRDTVLPFILCLASAGVVSVLRFAGAWSHPLTPPAPVGVELPPTRFQMAFQSSVAGRALRGSVVARAVIAFWRPRIGYHHDVYSADQYRPIEDLRPWLRESRLGRMVSRISRRIADGWRASGAAALRRRVVADIDAWESWQRIRLTGLIVLAALLLAAPLGVYMGQAWPTAIVWAGALACASIVIAASRPFARALADRMDHRRVADGAAGVLVGADLGVRPGRA